MKRLLRFLYEYRNLVIFILLELTSVLLIFNHQSYKQAKQLNTTNYIIGSIYSYINEIKSYSSLREAHKKLLHENAVLREQLMQGSIKLGQPSDQPSTQQYGCIPASVINNSIISTKNYLTINKGAMHGIAPGMGVISAQGIVGSIKAVSDHFATVTSLLHTDIMVSAKIAHSGVMGTVRWLGKDLLQTQLLYVPRHIQVEPGDTVVTSGYNATFYEGVLIGHVKQVALRQEALFHDIILDISTDFSTLQHVYVVKNMLKLEKDSLEQYTRSSYE